jgi:RHH-type transcriptional regulator, rel operon repressor / antitoxin RelB
VAQVVAHAGKFSTARVTGLANPVLARVCGVLLQLKPRSWVQLKTRAYPQASAAKGTALYLYIVLESGLNMLAIRLPAEVENRLEALAKATGSTKTFYAREAILKHLDDLEDLYLAEKRLIDIRAGKTE